MESITPTDGPYVIYKGKKLLDFSSYDFLGLTQHPEVKKGAIKYALKYGVGTSPLSLSSSPHREIEAKLAHYLGQEAALLFSSQRELQLQLNKLDATVISTETDDLTTLKKTKGLTIADDTFLIGIEGKNGFGSDLSDVEHIDMVCGSLLCGSGAFIAGRKTKVAALTSGALSFPVLGALDSALVFIPEMEAERKLVHNHQAWLVNQLDDFSIRKLRSSRVVLQTNEAETLRQFFIQQQIYLAPSQNKTICFSPTALHTPDDLDQLAAALKKLAATDLALAMQSLTPAP